MITYIYRETKRKDLTMQEKITTSIIIALIFCFLYYLLIKYLRYKKQRVLFTDLEKQDFEKFDKDVNSWVTKMVFPRYNVEYIKLNRYLLDDKKDKIEEQFDLLLNAARGLEQHNDIVARAFDYYVYEENKDKVDPLFEDIKTSKNEALIQHATLLYDILILNKANHIESMEKTFEKGSAVQKQIDALLLERQYRNINNKEKASFYENFLKEPLNK